MVSRRAVATAIAGGKKLSAPPDLSQRSKQPAVQGGPSAALGSNQPHPVESWIAGIAGGPEACKELGAAHGTLATPWRPRAAQMQFPLSSGSAYARELREPLRLLCLSERCPGHQATLHRRSSCRQAPILQVYFDALWNPPPSGRGLPSAQRSPARAHRDDHDPLGLQACFRASRAALAAGNAGGTASSVAGYGGDDPRSLKKARQAGWHFHYYCYYFCLEDSSASP